MTNKSPDHPIAGDTRPLIVQLEDRIRELTETEDSAFGRFTRIDWILCALGALIVPCVVLYLFRP